MKENIVNYKLKNVNLILHKLLVVIKIYIGKVRDTFFKMFHFLIN